MHSVDRMQSNMEMQMNIVAALVHVAHGLQESFTNETPSTQTSIEAWKGTFLLAKMDTICYGCSLADARTVDKNGSVILIALVIDTCPSKALTHAMQT